MDAAYGCVEVAGALRSPPTLPPRQTWKLRLLLLLLMPGQNRLRDAKWQVVKKRICCYESSRSTVQLRCDRHNLSRCINPKHNVEFRLMNEGGFTLVLRSIELTQRGWFMHSMQHLQRTATLAYLERCIVDVTIACKFAGRFSRERSFFAVTVGGGLLHSSRYKYVYNTANEADLQQWASKRGFVWRRHRRRVLRFGHHTLRVSPGGDHSALRAGPPEPDFSQQQFRVRAYEDST